MATTAATLYSDTSRNVIEIGNKLNFTFSSHREK